MVFGSGAGRPDAASVERVQRWAREVLGGDGAAVLVTELRCREPGCPPVETVIAVLPAKGERVQWKIPRGIASVTLEDVRALPKHGPGAGEPGHSHG